MTKTLILMAVLLSAGCTVHTQDCEHTGYYWQRSWSASVEPVYVDIDRVPARPIAHFKARGCTNLNPNVCRHRNASHQR